MKFEIDKQGEQYVIWQMPIDGWPPSPETCTQVPNLHRAISWITGVYPGASWSIRPYEELFSDLVAVCLSRIAEEDRLWLEPLLHFGQPEPDLIALAKDLL